MSTPGPFPPGAGQPSSSSSTTPMSPPPTTTKKVADRFFSRITNPHDKALAAKEMAAQARKDGWMKKSPFERSSSHFLDKAHAMQKDTNPPEVRLEGYKKERDYYRYLLALSDTPVIKVPDHTKKSFEEQIRTAQASIDYLQLKGLNLDTTDLAIQEMMRNQILYDTDREKPFAIGGPVHRFYEKLKDKGKRQEAHNLLTTYLNLLKSRPFGTTHAASITALEQKKMKENDEWLALVQKQFEYDQTGQWQKGPIASKQPDESLSHEECLKRLCTMRDYLMAIDNYTGRYDEHIRLMQNEVDKKSFKFFTREEFARQLEEDIQHDTLYRKTGPIGSKVQTNPQMEKAYLSRIRDTDFGREHLDEIDIRLDKLEKQINPHHITSEMMHAQAVHDGYIKTRMFSRKTSNRECARIMLQASIQERQQLLLNYYTYLLGTPEVTLSDEQRSHIKDLINNINHPDYGRIICGLWEQAQWDMQHNTVNAPQGPLSKYLSQNDLHDPNVQYFLRIYLKDVKMHPKSQMHTRGIAALEKMLEPQLLITEMDAQFVYEGYVTAHETRPSSRAFAIRINELMDSGKQKEGFELLCSYFEHIKPKLKGEQKALIEKHITDLQGIDDIKKLLIFQTWRQSIEDVHARVPFTDTGPLATQYKALKETDPRAAHDVIQAYITELKALPFGKSHKKRIIALEHRARNALEYGIRLQEMDANFTSRWPQLLENQTQTENPNQFFATTTPIRRQYETAYKSGSTKQKRLLAEQTMHLYMLAIRDTPYGVRHARELNRWLKQAEQNIEALTRAPTHTSAFRPTGKPPRRLLPSTKPLMPADDKTLSQQEKTE